jgi:hypothetical protein
MTMRVSIFALALAALLYIAQTSCGYELVGRTAFASATFEVVR